MNAWNPGRGLVAGLGATAVMTALMLMGPAMGLPRMDIGAMLGTFLGIGVVLGWAMHFAIGVLLALIYACAFVGRLPGPAAVRGMLYGLIPWLVAQVAVMPMMGMGLFGGSAVMAGGSLLGHLVYGGVLGALVGIPAPRPRRREAPAGAPARG